MSKKWLEIVVRWSNKQGTLYFCQNIAFNFRLSSDYSLGGGQKMSERTPWIYLTLCISVNKPLWGRIEKTNEPELCNHWSYLCPALPYMFESFLTRLKVFEVKISKLNFKRLFTSIASKTALPNILKIASNKSISSKDFYMMDEL